MPIGAFHQLPIGAFHQLPIGAFHQLPIGVFHQLPIGASGWCLQLVGLPTSLDSLVGACH